MRVCLRVCVSVCVITKPERLWALQHIKYSIVSFRVSKTMCGERQQTEMSDCHAHCETLESPVAYRVTLTPSVDHTSCAEENDGSFPIP